jgi:hypothetical protein
MTGVCIATITFIRASDLAISIHNIRATLAFLYPTKRSTVGGHILLTLAASLIQSTPFLRPYPYDLRPAQVRRLTHTPKHRTPRVVQVQWCVKFNDISRFEDEDSVVECDGGKPMRDAETKR